ncbi:UDP-glucuronic acid decarboxylase 4 [Euphorbia peplus]|nr:UDP-glucuronic acid decarboxylase 4 [Euphorbia peplus]
MIFRGHEDSQHTAEEYSPKPPKRWLFVTRPIRYILREQRLIFTLIGISIATLYFTFLPSSSPAPHELITDSLPHFDSSIPSRHKYYEPAQLVGFGIGMNSGGKIPLGLRRKGMSGFGGGRQ